MNFSHASFSLLTFSPWQNVVREVVQWNFITISGAHSLTAHLQDVFNVIKCTDWLWALAVVGWPWQLLGIQSSLSSRPWGRHHLWTCHAAGQLETPSRRSSQDTSQVYGHPAGAPPGRDPGRPQLTGTLQQVSDDDDDVKANLVYCLWISRCNMPQRRFLMIFLIWYYELVLSIIPLLAIPAMAVF